MPYPHCLASPGSSLSFIVHAIPDHYLLLVKIVLTQVYHRIEMCQQNILYFLYPIAFCKLTNNIA